MDGLSQRLLYLYLGYWLVALLWAVMQISGLNYTSNYTLILLCINVLSFTIGYFMFKIRPSNKISFSQVEAAVEKLMSKTYFKALLIGCTVLALFLFSIYFQRIMLYQSIYDVRSEYYENELYGGWFQYLNYFLLWPLAMVVIPVFAYSLFYKRNTYTLIMAIYLLAYESLSGARGGYVAIIAGFVFIIYCVFNAIKRSNPRSIVILTSSVVALLLIVFLTTAGRMGIIGSSKNAVKAGMDETFYQIGIYTAAPIAAFDYSIKNNYSSQIGGLKYGKLTLSSVEELYNLFASRIGMTVSMSDVRKFVSIKQSEFIIVGNGDELTSHYNALYTAVLWFYLDFGILGVISIPFLLGILVRWVISQTYKYFSIPMLAVCYVAFYYTVNSVKDFYLRSGYVLLMLIVLYIVGKKTRIWNVG